MGIKVRSIGSNISNELAPARTKTYEYICSDLTSEWLTWGEEESIKIASYNTELLGQMSALKEELRSVKIKVAHASASQHLGAGKSVQFAGALTGGEVARESLETGEKTEN